MSGPDGVLIHLMIATKEHITSAIHPIIFEGMHTRVKAMHFEELCAL